MFRRGIVIVFVFFGLAIAIGAVVAHLVAGSTNTNVWIVAGVSVLAVVGIGLVARMILGRSFAPVGDLIDATRRLGDGETGVRIPIRSPGPLAAVNASFNRMAERLEEEDERRRRFLADVGHEMRTPLTVIRGEVEAVLDGLHPVDSVASVLDEVELMDRLLDDLRVMAMAEAGGLTLHRETTDLISLVEDVVGSFSVGAEAQGVSVVVDTSSPVLDARIDPHRVRQILGNIISNAMKQMPEGGRLGILVRRDDGRAVIEVTDTGPGIPEDRLDEIFDRFVRIGDSAGTGLGLSIARDLAEAHDGSIRAVNEPGGGARLVLMLPLEAGTDVDATTR